MLDDGARVAAVKLDLISASPDADLLKEERAPVFIDLGHLDPSINPNSGVEVFPKIVRPASRKRWARVPLWSATLSL